MTRAQSQIRPITVSQHTSAQALGLDGARFLDLLRLHPEVPRVKSGRTVMVRTEIIEALLLRLESAGEPVAPDDEEPKNVDEALRSIGMKRKHG